MTKRVKIQHRNLHEATIEVDGHDLAPVVNGYTITADLAGPRLELSFTPALLPEFEAEAEVQIPDALRDALVGLGWTPPASGEVTEHEISTLGGPERVFLRSDGTYRTEPWHVPKAPDMTVGSERKRIGPPHAHQDGPCSDTCWEDAP